MLLLLLFSLLQASNQFENFCRSTNYELSQVCVSADLASRALMTGLLHQPSSLEFANFLLV